MTGPDVTGMDEYAEKAARDAEPLSDRVRREEHLWLSGVRRDPNGEVRFLPSNPGHGMSGTYAGQVTASIDAMLAEARVEERERIAEALATCSCGCDVTNHYTVCSTYGCPCRLDRDRAQLVAADHAARIARGEAT